MYSGGPSELRTALGKRPVSDVVLIEDNTVDRRLIHAFFHRDFNPMRWREFDSGLNALNACREAAPELLLIDLQLPDSHGLEIVRELRRDGHTFPVIVLTSLPETSLLQHLFELNISGYLDKTRLSSGLPAAVNSVLDGRMFFSASRTPFPSQTPNAPLQITGLSAREVEIVRLVVHGFPSKQIASHLNLSARTVENHRARIMTRLDLVNVADLVRWCMNHGIN